MRMRVMEFSTFITKRGHRGFDDGSQRSAHFRRAAYNQFRQLGPVLKECGLNHALQHLRAKKKGLAAQTIDRAYGVARHGSKSPWELVAQIETDVVLAANKALDALAKEEQDLHTLCADINDGSTIAHKDLPALDTPTGFMTPQAWKNSGPGDDAAAVGKIFSGDNGGERSAPMGGFTHIHVAGDAHNVMSYDLDSKKILAFTDHMDTTKNGKAESAKAVNAISEAGRKGWVWVAIIKDSFYRITSI
jgi:hypothetical protein